MSVPVRQSSPVPSRLFVFLPAVVVLVVTGGALWLDRRAWEREQAENARALLARTQQRFWEQMPLSPDTLKMPVDASGRPAWQALTFPDVPVPQAGEPALAAALRAGDFETVWNQGAGQLSAAGLPLRLLALRALTLKAEAPDIDLLSNRLREVIWSEPSALTPFILEEIGHSMESRGVNPAAASLADWRRQWAALLTWRTLYLGNRSAFEAGGNPRWFTVDDPDVVRRILVSGRVPWMAMDETSVRQLVATVAENLPGVRTELGVDGAAGKVLAESDTLPALRVMVRDSAAYMRGAWKRTAWLGGFAALAVAGTLWGSRQMVRALRRQAELSRQKSNFIASVSHELRTPLTSLRVLSENLHEGRVGEAEMRASYFPLMVDETRRLSALVENVLEFARAEDGRTAFQFAETDVSAMATDTVKLVQLRAQQRGLQLETELAPLPAPVVADAMSLHRALLNLLDNAIKFTPPGGRVIVSLRHKDPDIWSLSVQDTGPGIPRSEHERVFERFYRTGSELTRTVPGTGIGLSIVQHIAEGHDGKVILTSSPGCGATFTLRLPYQPPQTRSQRS